MPRFQIKRGLKANLPTSGMLSGELFFTTDRGTLHGATDPENRLAIVPAIDDLAAMSAVDPAADLLLIHDASESGGQKEKRITLQALRTALNIPEGVADEKVAVVSGGTSGFIWGTDGTDGVIRLNSSLVWVKDPSNGFVTLAVGTVDGGTF